MSVKKRFSTSAQKLFAIILISFLLIGAIGAPERIVQAQASGEPRADAVVLVNSDSAAYDDFVQLIQPYLDHFGVPYTVLDISASPIPADIDEYAVIIIGHRSLDIDGPRLLTATEEGYISNAVNTGTGFVNFDNDLSANGSNPRYQFINDIFTFGYNSVTSDSDVTFANPSIDYIIANHSNGQVITTNTMSLAGISLPGDVTMLASSGTQPFVAVTTYGTGHAVQFGSYDWISHAVKGPLFGLDDLFWRSIVWAARKPFVMQGLPPFVTMRMDDTSGPLWWIHIANEYGFVPWAGVFTNDIDAAEAADLSTLVDDGKATSSIHAFENGTNRFFYYDHNNSQNYDDATMAGNYAEATQWFADNDITIGTYTTPHYYEIGSNAFDGLQDWGIRYVSTMMDPGQNESSAPWMMAGPFRKFESGNAVDRTYNVYYADYMPTQPGFFNCITEIRDVTGYEWLGNGRTSVSLATADGIEWLKRPLDSMAIADLFSHEYTFISSMSQTDWRTVMQDITQGIASYDPIFVSRDYACAYARAVHDSDITNADYDIAGNQLTVNFDGTTDMPTQFYVFTEQGGQIVDQLANVPTFNGTTQVVLDLPGGLDHITITPNPASVIAGTTLQFSGAGFDASNNPIPGLDFTWSVVNGGGTIDANGLFTAGVTPGTYNNTVRAAFGSIQADRTVQVTQTTLDHFTFDTISSPNFVNIPFEVTIRARDTANNPVVTYNGTVNLSASIGTVQPATVDFVNGVWSGAITLNQLGTNVALTAQDGASLGVSNTFNIETLDCPCSIWDDTFTPNDTGNDGQAIEVGVKFQSSMTGYITGLRFYKDAVNTGTHTGHLWAGNGTQLAEAVFTSETASGWQNVYFSTPVQIQANTTYVASYHSTSGYYSNDDQYFTAAFNNPPLRALANGEAGPNGVYIYGASAFPTQTFQNSNYWVDVIFDTTPQVYSIWEQAPITGSASVNDSNAIEAGFKFKSDVPGSIIGVTFYKGPSNTGPFIGHLWQLNGTQLATKNYANNTAEEGWQEILFDSPIHINANTTYVASYFTQSGYYAAINNYFSSEIYNPPLRALANSDPDGPNGVYNYYTSGFPATDYHASNYWVDVLFAPDTPIDNTPPTVTSVSPLNGATNVSLGTAVTVTFNEAMDSLTLNTSTFVLRDASNNLVPASVSYNSATRTATLTPNSPLTLTTTYTARVVGEASGAADAAGNPLAANYNWSFSTLGPPPNEGPGGPILVLSSAANPFSRYYAEILRAEGLNEFTATDISNLTAALLNNYQVVILGEFPLTSTEVGLITNWVNAGGNLIAMRPDPQLAGLLGLTTAGATLGEGYLLVNTTSTPGQGIVNQTMQYHGTADLYTLNGATTIATLYSNATTATANPAVTTVNVGLNGGQAAAFSYDLAKSIVYTRQGNPAWADINGDSSDGPVRADDMFHNGTDPDWVNLSKVAIPQADEQQRLLVNMILSMNADENPLPHFWYFPRFEKAVVLMTADDHSSANTAGRFDQYIAASPPGCSVADWECIRSSEYIYSGSALTEAQAIAYTNQGFEVGVHVDTGCGNFTLAQLDTYYTNQLAQFATRFPTLPQQDSERTHCIAWSNWAYQPTIKEQKGIRLDTNYYFWPPEWVNNTPGFFTGSGIPMRFADLDGTMFDVFQATTQMTDESGQSYPFTIDTLLNRAVGAEGYYGVFTANMHSDGLNSSGSDAIVASAQSHDVPVVSGRQLLEWIDGRNFSAFSGITWNSNALDFHVSVGGGANGLYALLPTQSNAGPLQSITRNGMPVLYTTETVKGIEYAVFSAESSGDFQAVYSLDATGPVISNIVATVNPDGTVTITWNTDEASDSRVDFGTDSDPLNLNSTDSSLVTAHSITLTGLTPSTMYYFRVTSADASTNSSTSPIPSATPLDFTTPSGSLNDTLLTDFNSGTLGCTYPMQIGNGALILTPAIAAEFDGFVLPSGWSSHVWSGTAPTFGGGQVTLNGVSIRNDTLLNAGTSLEFAATFGNQSYQHIGFGGSEPTYNGPPWAMFSTGSSGDQLYARVHTGSGNDDLTPLGASYLGSSHQYRIDWNAASVDFYIDGTLVLTRPIAVPGQMRVAASDLTVSDPAVVVDWMHVSPYASPCTFTSHVFDAGQSVNWETLSWTGQTPAGTSFAFSYRIGNTPTSDDGSWTPFASVPSSGSALSGNTRYIQYQTVLATTNNLVTPVLEDVSITYSLGADVTAPTIVGRDPAPNESDVDETTDITVTFSEPMDPTTIIPANFALVIDGPNTPVPFTLTYSGVTATLNPDSDLTPGTQYAVHVDGAVEDLAGNPLGTDSDWTFVSTVAGLIDTTVTNFGAGANACYISETANGELILNPTVAAEFSGAALPAGWTSAPWTGGTSTVSGGQVTVDGALAYYSASTFTPGRSMEFVATFTNSQYQHVGLLGAADFEGHWAIFSTNDTTDRFYARTYNGTNVTNTLIPGTWLGTPHRYRIDWTATTVSFYIDGTFYAQHNIALADMRPAISEYNVGGTTAIVDWMRMSPYGTPCTFESRIFDAGSVVDWQNLISTGSTPVGTTVAFQTRTGNTPATLSEWEPTSGVITSPNGQYAQYRVTLGTSNVDITPIIESVELTYLVVVNHAPTTSGIADVTVDEDASDSTLDLWTSFADSDEPDSALTYTIEANTNPTLFTSAAITGNQNLVLDFEANQFGTADITIRATDSGGLYVEDTFTVTVNLVNDIPTTTGITNVTVDEDALDTTIDLFPSFADVEDADTALTYTVTGNTDATLFTSVTVTGGQNLVLDYAPNANGTADITIRATDTGTDYIETTFTVTVNPVNDTPTDIALTNDNVDENLAIGTLVGTLSTTDVDTSDTFTYTFCGGANDAAFSLSGDQLLTAASFDFEVQNSYSICIRSIDPGTVFFDETFTISVDNVNEAPTTSGIAPVTVDEDAADSTLDLWTSFADAEDADGALTYSIENNTNPTLFTSYTITGGQNLVLNYAPNTSGTAVITIRATDTGTLFAQTTFTVTVDAVNDNPTTSGIANLNVNEDAVDSTIDLFPSFADVEDADNQMTYTVTGNTNPALFTSTNVTGGQNLVLDFAPNANGSSLITVRATDTGGFYIETTFTVTIAPVNDDPTTSGIAAVIVNEDAPNSTIDLWTSFADLEDADAQLSYTVTGNTNAALFTSAGIAGNQNLVLDYAPNAYGSSQITIRATDTGSLFVPTTFTVTVNPVNDAPFFTSAPITSGTEDAAYTYNIVTLDPDTGDTLVISAPTLPGWLTLTDNNDGTATLTGTPANANVGINNVTLRVNDGTTDVDQTFTIDIANVNDPPAFTSTPVTIATEDAAYTYNVTASDPDLGAVLTFTAPTLPSWLILNQTGNGTATLSGTPINAEVGTHNVTLSLTDGTVSVDQIFVITVANTNDAPAFTSAPVANATEDAAYAYNITAVDPDLGDTLTITAPTPPSWLSFTDNGSGTASLTGTPTNAEVGTHNVTLTVSDGTVSVDQIFVITVANTNDSPAFTSAPITIAAQGSLYTYNVIATDPDSGDLLTLSTPTLPMWLTLTPTGNGTATLSGTPTNADIGINNVTLRVNDGMVDIDQVFTINVTDVNETPTDIDLSNATIDEGLPVGSLVGALSTTDPDLGDTFTYSFCGGADDASFQFNGSNLETAAILDADAQSNFTICIHSQDAGGSSIEETFVITLNNVNDAPVITLQSNSQNVNENSPLLFNNVGNTRITVSDADAGANPVQVTLSVTQGTLTLNSVNGLTFTTGTGTADAAMTFSGTLANINTALDGMRYDPVLGYNGADQLQVTVDDLGNSGTGGAQSDSASMDINVLNTAPKVLANGVNTVADTGDGILSESEVVTANITQFIITFDQDLNDAGPTDPDSVTNLNNYRLIHDNGNDFQTLGCDGFISAQDIAITINSVVYDNNDGSGPFIITLNVNDGLPLVYGNYRLYLCGTTTITDPTGLELAGDGNNAGTDFIRAFTIPNTTGGGGTGGDTDSENVDEEKTKATKSILTSGALIPVTGFEPGVSTPLPTQTSELAYTIEDDLRLEIPALNINQPIVGIPFLNEDWNVTWLGSRIGYLEGSAYPTWSGNTVLTGHATDPNGKLTSFGFIKNLTIGDKVMIHSNGLVYVYQIQQNRLISASSTSALFRHEEHDWVTLVTCENWNNDLGKFVQRRIVRAALVSVIPEK